MRRKQGRSYHVFLRASCYLHFTGLLHCVTHSTWRSWRGKKNRSFKLIWGNLDNSAVHFKKMGHPNSNPSASWPKEKNHQPALTQCGRKVVTSHPTHTKKNLITTWKTARQKQVTNRDNLLGCNLIKCKSLFVSLITWHLQTHWLNFTIKLSTYLEISPSLRRFFCPVFN